MEYKCSRRSFSAIAGSGIILAGIGYFKVAGAVTLYGDGHSDDTYALQCLIDGYPVVVAASGVVASSDGGVVRLLNGKFRLSGPLKVKSGTHLHVGNCTFLSGRGTRQPYPPSIYQE